VLFLVIQYQIRNEGHERTEISVIVYQEEEEEEIMALNVTFNNISAISRWSVLLVEETGVPAKKHRPVANHRQTLSHNVVLCISGRLGISLFYLTIKYWYFFKKEVHLCWICEAIHETFHGQNQGRILKLEKIWFFRVKSWFFTRNTAKIFAPPSARRIFI